MLKLIKNKRSSTEEWSLLHLLEVGLGVAIIIFLIWFSLKLSGLFFGRQDYDSAVNNLEALGKKIEELSADPSLTKTTTSAYSIPDSYILVGFSHDERERIKTQCTGEYIVASRPKICQGKSCLCIYKNYGGVTDWSGKDFDSKDGSAAPIRCKTFDKPERNLVFLTPYSDADPNFKGAQTSWKPGHYPNFDYAYTVIYGICGGPWRTSWGVRSLYIEKAQDGERIFVFMGDGKDKKIEERMKFFRTGLTSE